MDWFRAGEKQSSQPLVPYPTHHVVTFCFGGSAPLLSTNVEKRKYIVVLICYCYHV